MEYQVSARKYRPGSFVDVVGQGHVVQTLMNAITTKRIAHAFLFSGTRGVGKTTVARILAKALNCEQGPTSTPCGGCPNCVEITQGTSVDVIEIDGASNTSVDDVREVRENIKFAPFRGGYRVYIIDEVHMLSTSAFNALLKTLEEPPAHVVFVFATTEIHKIPATILSRCQHYNFRRISGAEIAQRLRLVAQEEGISIEDRSLTALARASEGSMRDGLSLLDQAVAFGGKTVQHADLEVLLGAVPREFVERMIAAIVAQDSPGAVRIIANVLDQGHDLRAYCSDLVEYVRNMLVAAVVSSEEDLAGLIEGGADERKRVNEHATSFTLEQLQELFKTLSQAEDGLRVSAHPRYMLEVAAVRATTLRGAARSVHPEASSMHTAPQEQPRGAGSGTPPLRKNEPSTRPPSSPPTAPGNPPRPPSAPSAARPAGVPTASPSPPPAKSRAVEPDRPVTTPAPATASAGPADVVPGEAASQQERMNHAGGDEPVPLDWDRVQDQVEAQHPNIAPFLERGGLVGVEGNQVTIGYSKADTVARGVIERQDNLQTLAAVCRELAGRPIRVRVVETAEGQAVGRRRTEIRASEAQEQKVVLLERTRAHPLVKEALALFGGEVIDVRRAPLHKEVRE